MFSIRKIIIAIVIIVIGVLLYLQQQQEATSMRPPENAPEQEQSEPEKTEPARTLAQEREERRKQILKKEQEEKLGSIRPRKTPSEEARAASDSPVEASADGSNKNVSPKMAQAPKSAGSTAAPPSNLYGDEAEALVTAQVKAYAAKDLGGLLDTFHPDIEHIDLKGGGRFEGLDVSWKAFGDMFRQVEWLKAEIVQKMVVGNVVIYIEKLEDSEDPEVTYSLVAHQLEGGLIRKIWYYNGLPSETTDENSGVPAANAQLLAYNNRDMEAFLAPYAMDVKIETLTIAPNKSAYTGRENMRPRYKNRFDSATGLNAQIRARLIQGNFVVDQEYVTWQGQTTPIQAIAIYRVEENLIKNVWFLIPSFK